MTNDEKLRIAVSVLRKVGWYLIDGCPEAQRMHMQEITIGALSEIQRDHYINEPSPVVCELLPSGLKVK